MLTRRNDEAKSRWKLKPRSAGIVRNIDKISQGMRETMYLHVRVVLPGMPAVVPGGTAATRTSMVRRDAMVIEKPDLRLAQPGLHRSQRLHQRRHQRQLQHQHQREGHRHESLIGLVRSVGVVNQLEIAPPSFAVSTPFTVSSKCHHPGQMGPQHPQQQQALRRVQQRQQLGHWESHQRDSSQWKRVLRQCLNSVRSQGAIEQHPIPLLAHCVSNIRANCAWLVIAMMHLSKRGIAVYTSL
jgi:hypothetical protein